mgnify:CR=1 FL=1
MKMNMFQIQTKDGTDLYGQVCCELKNQDIWTDILEYFLKYLNFKHGMGNMAIGVVEFSREGYKIRKVFA